MMDNNKRIRALVIGALALMMQSCAIPAIFNKDADTKLPETFQQQPADTKNAADIHWKDFFEDNYLSSLIDIAVVNNKEVNILLQRISMAENEIQARRSEYLPFVNFGASADVEKVGQYTRFGAVEENLEIKEGKSFPKYLGNYQFGLYSSWELDVWKKLRNATQVAATEYMASIEGKNFLVTNLVAEVAKSYYELLALDNQQENLQKISRFNSKRWRSPDSYSNTAEQHHWL